LEETKYPNDCFAVQDVAAPIYAIRKFKNPFEAVLTVSGMPSECEIPDVVVSVLLIRYRSLFHPSSCFGLLKCFLDRFHNASVMKSLRHKILGFEDGRNALRFRAEWLRFPQERHWPAENYLGIWSKDSPTGSSFCFVCAPDTTIDDWLSCFILVPMADFGCDLIIWKN
jgi:hypothetical protein